MVRCGLCEISHRKPNGESWHNVFTEKGMCRECYGLLDFFSWDNRWQIKNKFD